MTKMIIMFLLKKEVTKATKTKSKGVTKLPCKACVTKLKNVTTTTKYNTQRLYRIPFWVFSSMAAPPFKKLGNFIGSYLGFNIH